MTATPRSIEITQIAAAAADSKQAADLVALDVTGPLPLTDIFLMASGRNEPNVRAIAEEIIEKVEEFGAPLLRREGLSEGRWVLLDFGDVIVHVFHDEDRMFYSLERLWKDCPVVPLSISVDQAH
ncbi:MULTISPECIES: ribosome silencing factor [Subtercola]|uniref:Ribosomal silencing factor RsfS n=1 Tax=Subtercola vilae TaxID=2056433 RepID=A0A4T2BRN7_9MICO|nr:MULTISPECIES: ribosome silencing factor [Subtercola]MEA9986848.1 ribosome silencing factor [Subtercola sp. RTI3]TIH34335.1 ribosome silencing factor [Subtercola vilae]